MKPYELLAGWKKSRTMGSSPRRERQRLKILVFSDSHGEVEQMALAVEREQPELVIHLGDCCRDADRLRTRMPELSLIQVRGNCDYRSQEPKETLLCLNGKRMLLCHGHTYSVKEGLFLAVETAKEQALDLFLFGHTHTPFCDYRGGTLFLNPGSIGYPPCPSYGIICIEKGKLTGSLASNPQEQEEL